MQNHLVLCIDGQTDIGNRRHNNEDAWWIGQPGGPHFFMEPGVEPMRLDATENPVLLLVSDGVGGANAGEVASRMAVTLVSGGLAGKVPQLREAAADATAYREAVDAANRAITEKSAESGFEGMGATLSLLCFGGGGYANWAQAGDSRIYVCRRGRLRQISHDHSPVGRLRQSGKLTESEARTHPLRNQIDQSLGDPNAEFVPEFNREPVQAGDVFLLCSDGLSDGLWDREIEAGLAAVRTAAAVRPAVRQLVAQAKAASGRDNITAVLALVEGGPESPAPPQRSRWRRLLRL